MNLNTIPFVDDQIEYEESIDDSRNDKEDALATPLNDQNRFLPIATIAKMMKDAIPKSVKTGKEAKKIVQECVSEFISFITSEANDICQMQKRKTINGDDILLAMSNLGFNAYVEPLKEYLKRCREATKLEKQLPSNEDIPSQDMAVERLGQDFSQEFQQ